ncbi:hypothetical protein HJC23_009808 [Cyclotella cryptica]|uniref:NADPH-dependent FMN reductase-like domain-containing protein n=1 Tax=Cyclotella cryptica TaxID=29204 RepID=A0ABD3PRT8_9STRA
MSFTDAKIGSGSSDHRSSMNTALNDGSNGSNGHSGAGVRRRPPNSSYLASNQYGTYEGDSLLRYAPYSDEPVEFPVQYSQRRPVPLAWYRQPQKLIMIATLAWVGGVMYLANLAHAILRSQKESRAMGSPLMGMPLGSASSSNGGRDQVNVRFGMNDYAGKDADYNDWLERNGAKYSKPYRMEDYAGTDADYKEWLESAAYKASQSSGSSNAGTNVNVRFGMEQDSLNTGANFDEWLQYQNNNAVKYEANGKYGESQHTAAMLQSDTLAAPEALLSDSSVSTIDWPMRLGLPSPSCTSLNGCSPSNNVTILVVYGPEYHTHISEMAWQVATGVVSVFCTLLLKAHIQHHPMSPLHGHIIYGHTSNVTFLDVIYADAIIIGSPVYNGNIHPDIQNWINYWHIDADLSNKFGGAFVTAGGIHAGADGTIMSILRSMMVFQMMAVGGDSWTSPFGAVATMYEDPFGDVQRTDAFNSSCYFTEKQGRGGNHLVHPYFLRKAYGLGERITNVTVAWKNSSYVRWG